ncbi:MAG TPA: DUF2867 domain-containing protein [Caulobacteraceae bacterium]|nr:DUF2867 domain-containing protein [Caulobacteraceae bacterium]
MPSITGGDVPGGSQLWPWLQTATFHDTFEADLSEPGLSPIEIFQRASRATPRWAARLMAIRNRAVRLVGLKDVGALAERVERPAAAYQIGDRLGIFTLMASTDDEIVLGIDDRHLDVRVSVLKFVRGGAARYALSTAVRTHNLLGRLYMIPVGRIHPIIVRALMRGAGA